MLDLHNHVLFGLDDGCRTPEESVALALRAREQGHRGFVATPHIRAGMFPNTPEQIRARYAEVRPLVEGTGLELHLGAEHYFDEELLLSARRRSLLTLGDSRYALVELPGGPLPARAAQVIFELRLLGYVTLIAHPERSRGLQAAPDRVADELRQVGALFQLDLGSVIGHYGEGARAAAQKLLARGDYHVAAGDLHRPEDAERILPAARRELAALLKKRKKEAELPRLLEDNPRRILANEAPEAVVAV